MDDAIHVSVDDGVLALHAGDVRDIGMIVLEEVLGEYGRAAGVLQDAEVGLVVGFRATIVPSDLLTSQMGCSGIVQTAGKVICLGHALGGVGRPTRRRIPTATVAACVDMYADEYDARLAETLANIVHTAAALLQWNVDRFLDKQLCILADRAQPAHDLDGHLPAPQVLTELSVR